MRLEIFQEFISRRKARLASHRSILFRPCGLIVPAKSRRLKNRKEIDASKLPNELIATRIAICVLRDSMATPPQPEEGHRAGLARDFKPLRSINYKSRGLSDSSIVSVSFELRRPEVAQIHKAKKIHGAETRCPTSPQGLLNQA